MGRIAKILAMIGLAGLFVGAFGASPVYALQGVAMQEVNIDVLPKDMEPGVPLTGYNAGQSDDTSANDSWGAPNYAIGAAVAAGIVAVGAVVYGCVTRKRMRRKAILPVAGIFMLCSATAAGIFVDAKLVSAAGDDPVLELSHEALDYAIKVGESATLKFEAAVTNSLSSTGYTISAVTDDAEQDIDIRINEVDVNNNSAGMADIDIDDPVLLHSSATSGAVGEISDFEVTINLSDDIVPGDYKINVTYFVNTDEGEFFAFTIDTRMTDTPDTDATHYDGAATTFAIPTSGYVGRDEIHDYKWAIDWGDGTNTELATGTSDDESSGVPHTYASPGEYQITIKSIGPVISGWMNAFGFYNTATGANAQANKDMLKSIDSQFTDSMRTGGATYRFAYIFHGARNAASMPSYLFNDVRSSYWENVGNMFNSTFANYAVNSTSASIPAGLFDSINIPSADDVSNMFNSTFFNCANKSTVGTIPDGLFASIDTSGVANVSNLFRDTFFGYAAASSSASIPAGLFAGISLANGAAASDMFGGTFYGYASNSTSGTIPDGLFSTIDTTNAGNIVGMFSGTFSGYAAASSSASIPAGLFAGIHTDNLTETAYLFNGTFFNYARRSDTSIPAGLFSAVNTSNATNTSSMFAGTFSQFANDSTVATIPAGLFDAVNTSNATNTSGMFRDTFSSYAGSSTVATIPAGLFDSISTTRAVNAPSMFSGTFYFYGHASPTATIPAGLFTRLDLGNTTNVYEMFYRAFDSFAYVSTVPTDINSIWGNANFAGRVTADNVSSFFNSTFSNVTNLTGAAQTFIDSKLGGITPNNPASTFATTAVTDSAALNPNWK